ncbi:unnamed protein product [Ceratitis capitata]|uniref:(Mediterranean fruit fly) hypothetical protein n=1 Tax=Ceratitis capitata TaxID=7213 RepID=A0A811U9X1_CERCA|nr:unnamed protein product [Ceratitis capitata]
MPHMYVCMYVCTHIRVYMYINICFNQYSSLYFGLLTAYTSTAFPLSQLIGSHLRAIPLPARLFRALQLQVLYVQTHTYMNICCYKFHLISLKSSRSPMVQSLFTHPHLAQHTFTIDSQAQHTLLALPHTLLFPLPLPLPLSRLFSLSLFHTPALQLISNKYKYRMCNEVEIVNHKHMYVCMYTYLYMNILEYMQICLRHAT